MKEIKICYSIRDNIGDAINPYIIRNIIGYEPVHSDPYHCEISGIGSGLGRFFYFPDQLSLIRECRKELLKYKYCDPVVLWSAGFISSPIGKVCKARKNIYAYSVRGKLSLDAIKLVINNPENSIVVGDAGILAAELVPNQKKRYSIGIIPHDSERNEKRYIQLQEKIPNSCIIDVRENVEDCLKKISMCETVISSSLHGLVIADGMHIPNRLVKLTNRLAGDGFKFADYYSAYDLEPNPINLNETDCVSVYDIVDHYKIDSEVIEMKKRQLCDAFKKGVMEVLHEAD